MSAGGGTDGAVDPGEVRVTMSSSHTSHLLSLLSSPGRVTGPPPRPSPPSLDLPSTVHSRVQSRVDVVDDDSVTGGASSELASDSGADEPAEAQEQQQVEQQVEQQQQQQQQQQQRHQPLTYTYAPDTGPPISSLPLLGVEQRVQAVETLGPEHELVSSFIIDPLPDGWISSHLAQLNQT